MNDFVAQLNKQLDFIERSAAAYDHGARTEAVRIATALRVLFHQGPRSTSLITHLGAADIELVSGCVDPPAKDDKPGVVHVRFFCNLTDLSIGAKHGQGIAEFTPKLDNHRGKHLARLARWWTGEPVYVWDMLRSRTGQSEFTRADIVLAAADKDGGAHVDKVREPFYALLQDGAGLNVVVNVNGIQYHVSPRDAALAAIRQMAHEVLHSPALAQVRVPGRGGNSVSR